MKIDGLKMWTATEPLDWPDCEYVSPEGSSLVYPLNGQYIGIRFTVTDGQGHPLPGVTVTSGVSSETLKGPEWRTVDGLVARWPAPAAATLRQRIASGTVRLGARLKEASAVSGPDGKVTFFVEAWHVCGNEAAPATDRVCFYFPDGSSDCDNHIQCGVDGLAVIPSDASQGMVVSGSIVGRWLHPDGIKRLRRVAVTWRDTPNKPVGMPNFFTLTEGSLRWGGLVPPHLTHRFGGTCDLRPISKDGQPTSVGAANYAREGNRILISYLSKVSASEIRFADPLPGVTAVDPSHNNHIHCSFLRAPQEPWFRGLTDLSDLEPAHFDPTAD
jgi:hypothetical protein